MSSREIIRRRARRRCTGCGAEAWVAQPWARLCRSCWEALDIQAPHFAAAVAAVTVENDPAQVAGAGPPFNPPRVVGVAPAPSAASAVVLKLKELSGELARWESEAAEAQKAALRRGASPSVSSDTDGPVRKKLAEAAQSSEATAQRTLDKSQPLQARWPVVRRRPALARADGEAAQPSEAAHCVAPAGAGRAATGCNGSRGSA